MIKAKCSVCKKMWGVSIKQDLTNYICPHCQWTMERKEYLRSRQNESKRVSRKKKA